MKMNLFSLLCMAIIACSKGPSAAPVTTVTPPPVTTPTDTTPAQYGTPYNSVPDPRDVTMYQVNMRAFSSSHNFQGVINRLDSIKALGANVIYLMPVYPVGTLKSSNSPYC